DAGRRAGADRRHVQAVENRLTVAGVDLHAPRRRHLDAPQLTAAIVLHRDAEVRPDDLAAVLDRRVGDRHLQRRRLHVALADGEVDVVAERPRPLVRDPAGPDLLLTLAGLLGARHAGAPGAVGDRALDLAGQVD